MGQALETSVLSRVCLLCLCRTCKYLVFDMPPISACASLSWLVHLKASALLESHFFRLFVVNYVSRAEGFCFLNRAMVLAFSVEVLYKSGSHTSLLVSPFSGANSSTVAEFHLICDPIWDSCPCLLLAQTVHCFLQAPVKAAAAQIPKGILLVMLSLALGAECWAKVIPHMLASKKVAYLPHWCWFYCYYRVFVCRLKYQP